MKKWNINAIMLNDNSTFKYEFPITVGESTLNLFNTSMFKEKCLYKYTSFCVSSPSFYDPGSETYIETISDINEAVTMFHSLFSQWIANRQHAFTKIYEALTADYNPLWNVDGVEGIIYEDTHTGTDTNTKGGHDDLAHSGSDVDRLSGTDANVLSGRDVDTLSGRDSVAQSGTDTTSINVSRDETTRTGNESNAKSGTDSTGHKTTTFDSVSSDPATMFPTGEDSTSYGSTDTKTYNSVKDAHYLEESDGTTYGKTDTTNYGKTDTIQYGKTDTTNYGKVDTLTYGKNERSTYNSSNTEVKDLFDKHIEMKIRQGNIGVTKSTDLIESEIRLRDFLDQMIDYFIADFIRAYCIL